MATTCARPQTFKSSELKLLHRALTSVELLSDFPNASLLHKTFDDDAALIWGQAIDKLKEYGSALDVFPTTISWTVGYRTHLLFDPTLPAVRHGIGSNPEEPRRKGNTPPLEATKIRESLMKHLGRQILGLMAVADASHDERVNPLKVSLVKLGEAAGIFLCRLDEKPLLSLFVRVFQMPLRGTSSSIEINRRGREKVTVARLFAEDTVTNIYPYCS